MKHKLSFLLTLLLGFPVAFAKTPVSLDYPENDSQVAFAVRHLKAALENQDYSVGPKADIHIAFATFKAGMGPQAFRIQREGDRGWRIFGGDSLGLMYGGLEMAEMIDLNGGLQGIEEKARKPYVLRRGLKFNIPFDGRTPSYDDTGDAAQENIATMWDFAFWQHFLDTMALNRYNVLSLWTTNPYAGIVRLPKYPEANFDDVGKLIRPITNRTGNHFQDYDLFDPANHEIILKISLDDKIAYWTRVFDYAESLGIELYLFHWNIFAWGAEGKYGIDDTNQDNLNTIAYQRYCIEQFLKTYPQIDGIGVSAGEHVERNKDWKIGIEDWLYETYGKGMLDVLADDPDREFRFIFRHLWSDLEKSAEAFSSYPVSFNTSHKYARARLYSTTTSPYLDFEYREKLEATGVPCWLNFRNDDLFVHRWGNPDYVREFLQNIPKDVMQYEAGFYMGPDSYVWGKEFIHKDPDLAGQWEIDKHWFRFMLWGRLGYDLTLPRGYFLKRLKARFAVSDPEKLYETWATSSQIISWVDRFFFRVNDLQFAPEGCIDRSGFLTVDDSFFAYPPLRGSGILSVQEYARSVIANTDPDGITPLEVADQLDSLSRQTLGGIAALEADASWDKELRDTLADQAAMAALGRYYADKIRGAAKLAIYREDRSRKNYKREAVAHLEDAAKDWFDYATINGARYKPQLLS
ncbi:MAG: hypothetical protein KJT03_11910, partial [Verrucomicrobiae bacterium]|nr:hypothetical protein [Verrucomicrobiae bacterium]